MRNEGKPDRLTPAGAERTTVEWWRHLFQVVRRQLQIGQDGPEEIEARHRGQRVATVTAFTPLGAVSMAMATLIVTQTSWGHAPIALLLVWALVQAMITVYGLFIYRHARQRPARTVSVGAIGRGTRNGTLLGLTWGAMPVITMPTAGPMDLVLISVVVTAMITIGAVSLSAIPRGAVGYAVTVWGLYLVGLGSAQVEAPWMLTSLVTIIMMISVGCALFLSSQLDLRLRTEIEAERQRQVIGLLLKDFEENASDLLWETNHLGELRNPSNRLCRALRLTRGRGDGVRLMDRLTRYARGLNEGRHGLARLQEVFDSKQPFRDVELMLDFDGSTVYWAFTAKPVHSDSDSVSGWRGVISDVTGRRTTHASLVQLAHHCSLTGLSNRHHFLTLMAENLRSARETGLRTAVLLIDLDDFKKVNDSYGHSYGDALLKAVAKRLTDNVRQRDVVARLGGDEFAVMLTGLDADETATRFATRLLERTQRPVDIDDLRIPVGLSIGIAIAPRDGHEPDELMRAADLALYAAKGEGKGSYHSFSQALGEQSRRKRMLEEGLRKAITEERLHLAYQPQISVQTGQVTAFEALARWTHPELGPVGPSEFIVVAEETGMVEALGEWVLRTACRRATRWPQRIGIAVNVSATQAVSGRIVDTVRRALQETGLAPERLELEITESIFLSESPATLKTLHKLRELGVRIALDDFGVGYSSLAYLRRFPFNSLKIDRAFNGEIATNDQARTIVQAILTLARCLGMTTIAEGVEVEEQLKVLTADGCDVIQGYYFSPPLTDERVETYIARWAGGHTPPPERAGEKAANRPRLAA